MPMIRDFLEVGKDLEILWIAGLEHEQERGWLVRPATRDIGTGRIRLWKLPIGLWPILAPGRCFTGGDLARTAVCGQLERFTIPDLAAAEDVTSDCIPADLYSFDGRPAGTQRLLRYRANGLDCLVPTAELVRFLFLHNKTMTNTLMRPGGIMELFAPEELGHHPDLHLRFTDRMPRACLSPAFAVEFAWAAVHPEGRRSWDSVYEQSCGRDYVSFRPPAVRESQWTVRGVRLGDTVLVLEIVHITGRQHPCDRLAYSHPSYRAPETRSDRRSVDGGDEETDDGEEAELNARDYVVETSAPGSKSDVRQAALHAPGKAGSFDREIPVEKVIVRFASEAAPGRSRTPSPRREATNHLVVGTTVAEAASTAALPPVEFRLLEPAEPDYLGELEPLIVVVRRIAAMFPDVSTSMSLCRVKQGRSFSMAGRHRRICLIATFVPADGAPAVLLDVDHSGGHALSSLALRYRSPCDFRDMERHLAALVDGLVDNGGHWDTEVAGALATLCECDRVPRVLRRQQRVEDLGYATSWALRLAERLGLTARR